MRDVCFKVVRSYGSLGCLGANCVIQLLQSPSWLMFGDSQVTYGDLGVPLFLKCYVRESGNNARIFQARNLWLGFGKNWEEPG